MLPKNYVQKLVRVIKTAGRQDRERAKVLIDQLAGERIEEGQAYRNRLIFSARRAADTF